MSIKSALIGYTGFVGSNLIDQHDFERLYNTKNIAEIEGQEIDLVLCSGVSAVKWLANQEPQADIDSIENLKYHIQKAKIKHFVLISTVDIYDNPEQVNEDSLPDISKQDHYGNHRYQLEQWVASNTSFASYNVIRLPGLFGKHLKKNLIFDILNPLAKSINKALWENLQLKLSIDDINEIRLSYLEDVFGNLQQHHDVSLQVKDSLIKLFSKAGFSTLNFTDSRSSFQFYNLANLWQDITKTISANRLILNLSSEPITTHELVKYLTGVDFSNHTAKGSVNYNMYSKYANNGKYLYNKQDILSQIKAYVGMHK